MEADDIDELGKTASKWAISTDQNATSEFMRRLVRDYDVKHTCQTVVTYCARNGHSNVALQFPDHLLCHAPLVCLALKFYASRIHCEFDVSADHDIGAERLPPPFFYVIGDNSSGSCCVDEKTAKHLDTHIIVHFGDACLSSVPSIPVLYVFPRNEFGDAQHACDVVQNSLASVKEDFNIERVVILYDVSLHTHFDSEQFRVGDRSIRYSETISPVHVDVAKPRLSDPFAIQDLQQTLNVARENIIGPLYYSDSSVPRSRTAFIWFTCKLPTSSEWPAAIRNAALTLGTGKEPCGMFHCVSLTDGEPPSTLGSRLPDAQRFLRRRFVQLQKVKEASIVGLIPGDQSISNDFNILSRCKMILESAGKCYYTFVIGNPEPQKLANFPEVDVFVLASCPENAIFDTTDFLRPIITPLELEAALLSDGDIFSRPYSLEFTRTSLSGLYDHKSGTDSEIVTSNTEEKVDGIVTERTEWTVSANKFGNGAEFLRQRLWTGLKFDQGGSDDDNAVGDLSLQIEPGQKGIASRYDKETPAQGNS